METVLKAQNGDRAKNLQSIAETIDSMMDEADGTGLRLSPRQIHRIKGYMEQLRIISDELE